MVISAVIICPFIILFILFVVLSKFKLKKVHAFGYAADVTTILLFVSVPLIVKSVWEVDVFIWMMIAAILVAIVYTYVEWRKSKEIYIPQVLKRIWRMYFILLIVLYVALIIIGMIIYIIRFMQ